MDTDKRLNQEIENAKDPFKIIQVDTEHIIKNRFNLLYHFLKNKNISIADISSNCNIPDNYSGFVINGPVNNNLWDGWGEEKYQIENTGKMVSVPPYSFMNEGITQHFFKPWSNDIDKITRFKFIYKNKSITYEFFTTMGGTKTEPGVIRKIEYNLDFFGKGQFKKGDRIIFEWYQPSEGDDFNITVNLSKRYGAKWIQLHDFKTRFELPGDKLKQILEISNNDQYISDIKGLANIMGDVKYDRGLYSNLDNLRKSCNVNEIGDTAKELLEIMHKYKYFMLQ